MVDQIFAQRFSERFSLLSEVNQHIASILDIDELLTQVTQLVRQTFKYYHVGIGLIDGEYVVYRVGSGVLWDEPDFQFKPARLKVGEEGVSGWVAHYGTPLIIPDVNCDARYIWMQGSKTKSELTVPIIIKGTIIGVLDIQSDRLNDFDQTDLEFTQSLANQTGIAIENARLFAETQRLLKETEERNTELSIINHMQLGLASKLDMKGIYELVGEKLRGIFGVHGIVIYSFDHEHRLVIDEYAYEKGRTYEIPPLRMTPLHDRVISTGETIYIQENAKAFFEEIKHTMPAGEMPRSCIIVPFKTQGRVTGMIGIFDIDEESAFSESDVRLMETLTNSMLVALESARLFAETQRLLKETEQRAGELGIINSVQQGLASKLDVQSIYELVGDTFHNFFNAQVVVISAFDAQTNTVEHRYAIERGKRIPWTGTHPPGGFRDQIIRTKKPFLVNTNVGDTAAHLNQPIKQGTEIPKSWLGVPILLGDQVTGILSVQNLDEENAFGESDARLLQTFAASMSIALENARLYSMARRRAEQFRVITEVSQRITSILDINELLDELVKLVQRTFNYYHVEIGMIEGDEIFYYVGAGELWEQPDFQVEPDRLKVGKDGISGWVAASGKPLIVPDVSKEARYIHIEGCRTQSELTVPIKANDQIIGVLDVESDRLNDFDETDLEVMLLLANQAGVAIENARLYKNAKKVAALEERQRLARELHDSVTQSLYGINLYSQAASGHLMANNYDQVDKYLAEINETSQEALAEMRLLIYQLRPPVLDKEGLLTALQARLSAVEGRAGLKTSLKTDLTTRLPFTMEEGLYHIAQEALNNTLKHSHAKSVNLTLRQNGPVITLEIVDDGTGFDVANAYEEGKMGLTDMAEHATELGGKLTVTSEPGQGTHIRVDVIL